MVNNLKYGPMIYNIINLTVEWKFLIFFKLLINGKEIASTIFNIAINKLTKWLKNKEKQSNK